MADTTRILILAARLQPFLIANMRALLQREEVAVLVVHWPGTKDTPMPALPPHPALTVIQKDADNASVIDGEIKAFNPQIVLAPGWMDKEYLRWTKAAKQAGAATLMSMDNQWKGTLKQHLFSIVSKYWLLRHYDYAFVPGKRQVDYAKRLGFKPGNILTGFCTPDVALFNHYFETVVKPEVPHTFLYAGRLVAHKVEGLLLAFKCLSSEQRKGWKFIVAGEGPLDTHTAMRDVDIIRLPYQQQDSLQVLMSMGGVFCLTSSDEPWGTAIQEYAIAGFPLLLSDACGAAPHFLKDGYNGYLCDSTPESIAAGLLRFIDTSQDELQAMQKRSHPLGMASNNEDWVNALLSVRKVD